MEVIKGGKVQTPGKSRVRKKNDGLEKLIDDNLTVSKALDT